MSFERAVGALLAALALCAGATRADQARPAAGRAAVLDAIALPPDLPHGERLREVSGLAWDAARRELISVSDRGVLVRWSIDATHGRLDAVRPLGVRRIDAGLRVNAESVDVAPATAATPARLIVVDEKRERLLALGEDGALAATLPLPRVEPPVAGGIEAIAWHPRHGVLAATQWPSAADRARGWHRVVAADGRAWVWAGAPANAAASIKALHLLDERRLLVLEKWRIGARRVPVLRMLELTSCGAPTLCDAPPAVIEHPLLTADDNFEGLACLDARLCVIASDDGRRAAPRTVFALIGLWEQAQGATQGDK